MNSCIHIDDKEFALDDGLLPKDLVQGKIRQQFFVLTEQIGISEKIFNDIMALMVSQSKMVAASFLNNATKRNYWQSYQGRLKQLMKR